MNILVTGAYGRCGTAIIDHLHEFPGYNFTYLNRSDRPSNHRYGGFDTYVADVSDYDEIRPAFENQDAVIHLAAYPYVDGSWDDVVVPNIIGMYNVLEAARDAEVDSFIFGSTNHVMGGYEKEHAPDLYQRDYPLHLDPSDPTRPDSYYGATKSFGEDLGQYYAETYEFPTRFYALRICTVLPRQFDHPYGAAEQEVEEGNAKRETEEYQRLVNRTKATWHSRRDFAHLIQCCLEDNTVEFSIFHGVSNNDSRWFSIRQSREQIGYNPKDNGEEWDEPPA